MATQQEFDQRLGSIARDLLREPDTEQTLQRVVDLAAEHLEGEVWASISLVRRRRHVDTPASSDGRAEHADRLQYELGEGPCLDAIWEQETFQIDDMTTSAHYPTWTRRVSEETAIRSSLSLQLFTDEDSLGALNLYSPAPAAFAAIRGEALAFAGQAAIAVRSAQTEENLRAALDTRNLIGQAQGILMERYRLTAEQAFNVLTRASQESNTKLREVARRLTETGEMSQPDRS